MSSPDDVKLPMASSLQQIVGALLFGADHPLTVEEIRGCLNSVAESAGEPSETVKLFAEASPREINDAIGSIAKELSRLELGIEVAEINGGFRFQTQPCCGRWVRNLLKLDRPNRLSRPALETLAIIAYRQPIAKSEIEAIRGVVVDHIVKALMELHLIRIVGRSDLPGRPLLYGTTSTFLDHFGLKNLNELNELDPTLQRSKAAERKAVHKKEKKSEEKAEGAGPLFEAKPSG
jgi:segregation and condensation protein B